MGLDHSPAIVTDGLVYYLDAANQRCYSGSGLTANGLVGSINGSLVNGVGFTSTNNGHFSFDGTNDNIPFTILNFNNILSIEIWMKMKAFTAGHMPFGFYAYDVFAYQGAFGFNTAAGDIYGLTSTQVTNLSLLNQWKHYIFEMRSDVTYTNNKIYVNGEIQTLSQVLASENSSNRTFNSGSGKVSGWIQSGDWNQPMDLGLFKIYNRSLTQQEVLQNYNATKGRYGL